MLPVKEFTELCQEGGFYEGRFLTQYDRMNLILKLILAMSRGLLGTTAEAVCLTTLLGSRNQSTGN